MRVNAKADAGPKAVVVLDVIVLMYRWWFEREYKCFRTGLPSVAFRSETLSVVDSEKYAKVI